MEGLVWKINTSNLGKFEEFKRLFSQNGELLEVTHFDLEEIDADPVTVVAHKASQLGENVIVEDTSLEIENASIGVNIRWLLGHLSDFVGHKAEWVVLLAYREVNHIYIYKGSISGIIVEPRGTQGFGFDPYFLPDGAIKTLGESKPDSHSARAKAVKALLTGKTWTIHPVIDKWEGQWQK